MKWFKEGHWQKLSHYWISFVALAFALIDTFWVHISWVAAALVGLAALPWLIAYVSSLELPGGVKISTRDLRRVSEEAAELDVGQPQVEATRDFIEIISANPDLTLAGLRIEIERRLIEIARLHGKPVNERAVSIAVLTRNLRDLGVLRSPEVDVLLDLIPILNDAIHARSVSSETRRLVLNAAAPVLAYLDTKIGELSAIHALQSHQEN